MQWISIEVDLKMPDNLTNDTFLLPRKYFSSLADANITLRNATKEHSCSAGHHGPNAKRLRTDSATKTAQAWHSRQALTMQLATAIRLQLHNKFCSLGVILFALQTAHSKNLAHTFTVRNGTPRKISTHHHTTCCRRRAGALLQRTYVARVV